MRVRRFVLLHKQLDADDEELTRTRKVRRGTIATRYGDIIGALYSEADRVTISSVVAYQDGTTSSREISLRIASPNGAGVGAATERELAAGRH
jgi:long-chain acyl-CoA synthetase